MLTSRPFARIVFAAAWISFQPAHARGQEVEVVTESSTVSTANEGGASLLSPLPLHLVLSIDGGYDDNVPTSTTARGSLYTDGKVILSYDRKGVQDQVSLIAIAGGTYFADATGATPYDVDTSLALFVNHNVSERLKLTASIYGAYKTEPDLSSNVGLNNRRGNYFDTVDKFTATYHWTLRLATVPTFSFKRLQYENSSVASVNHSAYTFGDELRFNLSSRTVLVPEYRFKIVNYDSFAAQDSTTHFALIGIDEDFSKQLKSKVRCGATFQSFRNDGSGTNPHFEGSLDYALASRSSLSWQTTYGAEEANEAAVSRSGPMSRVTFRTSLVLNYALSARISANVSAHYHHDENQSLASTGTGQAAFPQDTYDLSLTGVYTIDRRFTFHLGFQRSQAISGQSSAQSLNQFTQPYSRGRYFAGLTFKY